MICISIGNIGFNQALSIAQGSDMIEIRQDLARYSRDELSRLITKAGSVVFTCRPSSLPDEERMELYRFALLEGASFIDTEIENDEDFIREARELIRKYNGELIISYHNYESTPSPEELNAILAGCYRRGADIAKIATQVNREEDNTVLLDLYRKKGRKIILGMGEKGMITRVAAIPLGSEFTFAAPDSAGTTAPGQLTHTELAEILTILKMS